MQNLPTNNQETKKMSMFFTQFPYTYYFKAILKGFCNYIFSVNGRKMDFVSFKTFWIISIMLSKTVSS